MGAPDAASAWVIRGLKPFFFYSRGLDHRTAKRFGEFADIDDISSFLQDIDHIECNDGRDTKLQHLGGQV